MYFPYRITETAIYLNVYILRRYFTPRYTLADWQINKEAVAKLVP